jgi:hypothetical protein
MWSKAAAVGNAGRTAARCPRSQPVRRRRIVHMSIVCRARSARPPSAAKFSRRLFHTSAGMPVDLRSRPRIISRARSARQALTRRCNVRSCALPAYASGNIVANRSINSLAEADGSAIGQPSTSGHASANGSTFVRHQCLAPGCLHAWVEPVHSSTPWTGS